VIAQRSLGGKARILWLSAGERELLVSVTAQQVSLLGQWAKTRGPGALPAALPAAQTHSDTRSEIPAEDVEVGDLDDAGDPSGHVVSAPFKPVSPAVSGILRLRGRTGQMPAVDGIAAGSGQLPVGDLVAASDVEADELWAREILAATGRRP
jgi:hypothetical protein